VLSEARTAPYGRGSESTLYVYGSIQSRDHRERYYANFCNLVLARIPKEKLWLLQELQSRQ